MINETIEVGDVLHMKDGTKQTVERVLRNSNKRGAIYIGLKETKEVHILWRENPGEFVKCHSIKKVIKKAENE